jgi:hypothetical protein
MQAAKKYVYLSGILVILLFACKKEKDKEPPVISITTPDENQVFNVNDNVHVTGTITDETALKGASVGLINDQGQPANVTLPILIKSLKITVDLQYAINNHRLETGWYQLQLFASDGIHDVYATRQIYIKAIPKMLKKILVTTALNPTQTNVFTMDTLTNALKPYLVFPGDHSASGVNSYYQQFYHCGKNTGHFKGINLDNNAAVVDVAPVITPSVPYFTGMYTNENACYISLYNKQIRGYDPWGVQIYNANAMDDFYSQHLFMHENYLLAEEQNKLTSEKKLVCFYPTGSAQQSSNLLQDVVAFCEKDASAVFVFGNKSGQGMIQLYDRTTNNLWDPYPYTLATGTITSAMRLDPDTYLIGYSNGTIYKYVYSASSVTPYLTGYTAIQLVKDNISPVLYVVEKNKISTFDLNTLKPIRTVTSTEAIVSLDLLYNR